MKNIYQFINLHSGEEDKKKVLENVKSGISFRGSNLWILACAIVVCSIGLNVNSTAVIIGAMLISPLMGPIVGTGFSLGIYDFPLLRRSLKNLLIATTVSFFVAAFYFYISPFKETQSELLARTSPNIYDVLIAFFGGLVGVIAVTRVEKGNPIPGVAIATALMPPLCTAGYGLAIGNLSYFAGALFLYTINCVFICIATFLIVKYLKYPPVEQINPKSEKQIRYVIMILITILILPSIYLAYDLWNERKFSQKIDDFINNEFINNGLTIIYKKTDLSTSPKKIEIAFLLRKFTPAEIENLNKKLALYNIDNTKLEIKQDTTNIRNIIQSELRQSITLADKKDLLIADMEKELLLFKYDNRSILKEAAILFPELKDLSIANHVFYVTPDSQKVIPVMIYKSKAPLSAPNSVKLSKWLKEKLGKDTIKIVYDK